MPLDKLIAVGLPIALGVVMIGAGAVNFIGPRSIRDSFARWGYPLGFHRVTGGLEMTAGLLLLIPASSRAGAIGRRDPAGCGGDPHPLSRLDTLPGVGAGRKGSIAAWTQGPLSKPTVRGQPSGTAG